jgi:hypothetical protein
MHRKTTALAFGGSKEACLSLLYLRFDLLLLAVTLHRASAQVLLLGSVADAVRKPAGC